MSCHIPTSRTSSLHRWMGASYCGSPGSYAKAWLWHSTGSQISTFVSAGGLFYALQKVHPGSAHRLKISRTSTAVISDLGDFPPNGTGVEIPPSRDIYHSSVHTRKSRIRDGAQSRASNPWFLRGPNYDSGFGANFCSQDAHPPPSRERGASDRMGIDCLKERVVMITYRWLAGL